MARREKKFILLEFPDGRQQRVVDSKQGKTVAQTAVERDHAKIIEAPAPYTADDALKARSQADREAKAAAEKRATAPVKKNSSSSKKKSETRKAPEPLVEVAEIPTLDLEAP